MKLMVISAIGREASSSHLLVRQIVDISSSHGVEVDFVTPTQVGLPINDGTLPWEQPEVVAWQERVVSIHAHIWVSPEYHSGLTGGLKNLFDWLGKEPMRGDVVGLCALAGGAMAALNTLNGMSIIARSLGAWVAPDHCAFNADEVKAGLDDAALRRLEDMCVSVVDMARRLNLPWPAEDKSPYD